MDTTDLDSKEVMLSTTDNPFSPFTQFNEWLSYDTQKGYNTCGLLDRIAKSANSLSDSDLNTSLDEAMKQIVTENVYGVHRLVSRDSFKSD